MPMQEKGVVYRFIGPIPTGISLNRYGRVVGAVGKGKTARDPQRPTREKVRPFWADHLLRLARERKHWNQGQLAAAAKVRGNTLSAILSGAVSPNLWTLECLATAVEAPLWLIFLDARQADILNRHERAEAQLANEDALMERIEQRILQRWGGVIHEETEQELRGRPVPMPAAVKHKPPQKKRA